jgi:hypothetical protein
MFTPEQILSTPEQIKWMRQYLANVFKRNNHESKLVVDMCAGITVVNELPEKVVSTKPLEIFYYANYKTEALEMVRDCIVFSWLHRAVTEPMALYHKSFEGRYSILCDEMHTLKDYCKSNMPQVQKDEIYLKGFNHIAPYDRDRSYLAGSIIWRNGVQQKVPFESIVGGLPTWRDRACIAAFATDISYGEFIPSGVVRNWR